MLQNMTTLIMCGFSQMCSRVSITCLFLFTVRNTVKFSINGMESKQNFTVNLTNTTLHVFRCEFYSGVGKARQGHKPFVINST